MSSEITRRALLQGVGASLALAACHDEGDVDPIPVDAGPPGPPTFVHGVASGDPTSAAVIVWTRVTPTGTPPVTLTVTCELARDEAFADVVQRATFVTSAQRDWTVKLDLTGLTPATGYHYRFVCEGVTSPAGRTRTTPEGRVDRVRFAVVTCSNYAAGYFHAYREIAARSDLDAVLHLGDYIYEYPDGYYGNTRRYEPPHEIVSLRDYRMRYAQARRDEDLQAVHARHPFVPVWDDHELANNAWRDGADEHMSAWEGPWPARRRAASQAYMEWMPLREQPDGRIYRGLRFGDLVHLCMLDTRLWGRDVQPRDRMAAADMRRQILGAAQEQWLFQEITGSRARWKVLGQQVLLGQFGAFNYLDVWDGYPAARARLFNVIRSMGVANVVVLTGDIHSSFAMDLSPDPTNPMVYNPATGEGSLAVEFVTPAVSSPPLPFIQQAMPEVVRRAMPHLKYSDVWRNGYLMLDVDDARAAATWMFVGNVTDRADRTHDTGPTWLTRDRENRLREG